MWDCAALRDFTPRPGNISTNHEALDQIGINNTAYVSPDTAHEFLTWRRSLHEFAPLLFTDQPLPEIAGTVRSDRGPDRIGDLRAIGQRDRLGELGENPAPARVGPLGDGFGVGGDASTPPERVETRC